MSKTSKTIELSRESVSFWSDVFPYYLPSISFIAKFLIYQFYNGNLMWPFFLAYLVNFPYYKWTAKLA